MDPQSNSHDAFTPREIARKVESVGVAKAHSDFLTLFALAILAGAFISLGAMFFLVVTTHSSLGFGVTRLLGGMSFCLGLVLVIVAGAELFTGNNLLAMAWASRLISTRDVLRNWLIVYFGNALGCLGTAALLVWGHVGALDKGGVGETAMALAKAKCALPPDQVFAKGILCNALVCLAVWLAMGGRSVSDKLLAVLMPVTAFVAIGLEHSIANWFFLAYGYGLDPSSVNLAGAGSNLLMSTLGNIVGGSVLVAAVYWVAYLHGEKSTLAAPVSLSHSIEDELAVRR